MATSFITKTEINKVDELINKECIFSAEMK